MNAPLHTTRDDEAGIEANVYPSDRGGFNVVVWDIDAEAAYTACCGIATLDAAIAYAQSLAVA